MANKARKPNVEASMTHTHTSASVNIPFTRPYFSEKDEKEILAGMSAVLKSGWLTSGKNVERLEQIFANTVGTRYAIAVNSCTAALHTVLLSLDLSARDEVLVPTNTFVATANSVLYTGAKPVFVDSDPDTFNMSTTDLAQKITPNTKAIIAVHLAGNPCDMDRIQEIAEDEELPVIEDCAHAHGSQFRGRNCGTFGLAGAFSFYATKVVTSAEGGIVTTDDEKLAQRIKRVRTHGRSGAGAVETTELGYNYRLSDIHAVIALSQMKHLSDFKAERQRIAQGYDRLLSKTNWIRPQMVKPGNSCPYYVYLVKLADEAPLGRDELAQRLASQGIRTSVLYYPVHSQPFYKSTLNVKATCPVAERLGMQTLALPMYNGMSDTEFTYVAGKLQEIIRRGIEQYA